MVVDYSFSLLSKSSLWECATMYLLVSSTADGHLGGFPVLASTNSVAMNILAQVLTHACVSIGSLPQNGITESQDIHMLLWIPLNSFPKQLNFLAFLPDMCEKSYFLFSFMPWHKEEE